MSDDIPKDKPRPGKRRVKIARVTLDVRAHGLHPGEHLCIGVALARKEAAIAFETLLEGTRDLRLSPGSNDFAHVPSFILRGLKQLCVEVTPA